MVSEGYKPTEVGVIPEDWDATLLDDIALRGSGHTPSKKYPEYWNGNIKWISLADSSSLDRRYIDETFAQITPLGVTKSSAVLHPPGTVVLSRDAGVGKSAIMRTEMAVSQHFIVWRCGTKLDNCFLYYWLQSIKPMFERIAIGSTIKTIGLQFFRDLKVPNPPLPEQQAIAEALSDMDGLIDGLEKLIAKKQAIKTATMQQLLAGKTRLPGFGEGKGNKQTELGEIPEDWEVIFLKGCCSSFRTGKLDANAMVKDGKYRFYTCASQPFRIDTYAFDTEALLISGNGANVGYVHYYFGKFNAYQRTYVLSEFTADVGFLKMYLEKNLADRIYVEVNSGSTPYITMDTLTEMPIVLPSNKQEQIAIALILSDMDKERKSLQARLNKTKSIKQGMMQELLTGRTRLI